MSSPTSGARGQRDSARIPGLFSEVPAQMDHQVNSVKAQARENPVLLTARHCTLNLCKRLPKAGDGAFPDEDRQGGGQRFWRVTSHDLSTSKACICGGKNLTSKTLSSQYSPTYWGGKKTPTGNKLSVHQQGTEKSQSIHTTEHRTAP